MEIIRQVFEESNWDGIASVFNYYVITSIAAYPSKQLEGKFFYDSWKSNINYPFYEVIHDDEGIGFSYMRPFHSADSMSKSVVFTYFISPSHTGKGIGQKLLDLLIKDGRKMGKSNFLVNISSDNEGSINFHTKHGFKECGCFRSIGKKDSKEFDMIWMQKIDNNSNQTVEVTP